MTERLRELERAHAADPSDLGVLRELADERRRRGLELLPILRPPPQIRTATVTSRWRASAGGVAGGVMDAWQNYAANVVAHDLSVLPSVPSSLAWRFAGERLFVEADGTVRAERTYAEVVHSSVVQSFVLGDVVSVDVVDAERGIFSIGMRHRGPPE